MAVAVAWHHPFAFRIHAFTIIASLSFGSISARAELRSSPPPRELASLPGKVMRLEVAPVNGEEPPTPMVEGDPPAEEGLSYIDEICHEACRGWYVSLSGGLQGREDVSEVGNPATFLTFDDGFALNGAIGYQFDWLRWDLEYSFFNNQVETAGAGVVGLGNFVGDATGNINIRSFTLNGYYDFRLGQSYWRPYVGGGIGMMQSEINSLYPDFFPALGAATGGVNTTSDFEFCYQIRAGLNYMLTHRTDVYGGYRYFDAGELTFASPPFGVFHPDGATFHNFEMGFRVRF